MVLPYAARLSGLGHRDLAQVECACGRTELLTAAMLATAGMAPKRKVFDLGLRQRCRERDEKGRAVVSISGPNKRCHASGPATFANAARAPTAVADQRWRTNCWTVGFP